MWYIIDSGFLKKFNSLIADIGKINEKMEEISSIKSIVTQSKKNLGELTSTVNEIKKDNIEIKSKIEKL